ncbi:hypothetical protein ACTXT7_003694 [Hymenolepis weldensis]
MSDQNSVPDYLQVQEEDRMYFLREKAKRLKQLQSEGLFCNCTIDVGGKLFNVHLEILCASSEYFDRIIRRDSDFEDVVTLHNMTPETFQIILDYLYTGCVEINSSNIVDIYIAADFLILSLLLDRCRAFFRGVKDKDVEAGITIVSLYDDEIIFRNLVEKRNLFKKRDLLRQLGSSYFFKMLQYKDCVLFVDKGIMHMGLNYLQRLQNIFSDVFPEETRKVTKEDCESMPRNTVASSFRVAKMPTFDESVDYVDNTRYSPWEDLPPDTWTISRIIFYIIPSWGDTKGLIGGADVEYRNIWTGERKMDSSPFKDFLPSDYSKEILELEEGETINGFTINSGWLVDQMTFTTSKGRQLGPFGHSEGGNRMSITIPRRRKPKPRQNSGKEGFKCLALHGFSFSLIRTLGCCSWYNIRFVYSCVHARLANVKGLKI